MGRLCKPPVRGCSEHEHGVFFLFSHGQLRSCMPGLAQSEVVWAQARWKPNQLLPSRLTWPHVAVLECYEDVCGIWAGEAAPWHGTIVAAQAAAAAPVWHPCCCLNVFGIHAAALNV